MVALFRAVMFPGRVVALAGSVLLTLGADVALVGPAAAAGAAPRCSDVLLLAVPGSNETDPDADPQQPRGLLAEVTGPLNFPAQRLQVRFVPYPASVFRPVPYPASEARGVARTLEMLRNTDRACPGTQYLLLGYSQGADVAGDVAARIGQGNGPVPAGSVLGVGLIAGPQYDPDAAATAGEPVTGEGILGARPQGFGAVADRVVQVCVPGDPICDPPEGEYTVADIREALESGVHTSYSAYEVDRDGTTALEYLTTAARAAVRSTAR